ncbi:ABC-type branched-chain amino acid transport system, periplasmic component [Opitutaceae bacterium TAV1]|nr:ABC-type branched-chain amino acid transport system, periplasmic component [Opitutaceae bacterium TAV1]
MIRLAATPAGSGLARTRNHPTHPATMLPLRPIPFPTGLLSGLPLALAVVLFTAPFLPASARAAEPIKVGEYNSLTGKEASFGQSTHRAIVLAVEEINAAGGVLGRPLQLVTEDNQSKAGESATAVRKLISRDKVVAVIGEATSGRSLEAAPLAQRARIPMIATAATNPRVTETGNYIFRTCFIDPFQGTLMARFARDTLGFKRVALLTSVSSAYSVGLSKFFHERFTADGGTIAAEQKYSEGDKDFRAQLTAIKASGADAVFVPGYYTEVALAVRQARDLGLAIPFIGGDGWEAPQLLEIGGDALNGCYYSAHFSPQNAAPLVQAFVKNYQARWGGLVPDAFAALGYDAIHLLADAIRRAGTTDGPALRDALAATQDLEGVTGATTFDAQRNPTKAASIITIADGKFRFDRTIAP